jgi:hypothetical protein
MLKPMLKLIRHRGRGFYAPALLAAVRPNFLMWRFGRASRGHLLAGAGVIAAAVTVVSLLTWWAPDSDRPISHPMEAIKRVLPGVLEKVDEQVATLLGTDKGTVLRDVRGGLVAVGSSIPWPGGKPSEATADQSTSRSASTSPAALVPAILTRPNTVTPSSGEPSPTSNDSPPSQTVSEPASAPAVPASSPATEAPSPTTSGPAPPPTPETPPVTEAPSPEEPVPPTPEKLPLPVEEIVDKPAPPTVEEPPSGAPPPVTEAPPPAPDEPPPATDQPPPPPTTGARQAQNRM